MPPVLYLNSLVSLVSTSVGLRQRIDEACGNRILCSRGKKILGAFEIVTRCGVTGRILGPWGKQILVYHVRFHPRGRSISKHKMSRLLRARHSYGLYKPKYRKCLSCLIYYN